LQQPKGGPVSGPPFLLEEDGMMCKIRFWSAQHSPFQSILSAFRGRENVSRILKLCFTLLVVPAALLAQGWPLPAKTPNTEVPCNPCPGYTRTDLVTVGYSSPITTFTGRFLDSQTTNGFQQPFRTARAHSVMIVPDRKRVYMLIGSGLGAWDMNTFFTRLASGENLVPITVVPVSGPHHADPQEQFLLWDKFFYAENGSPWQTIIADGDQRLYQYDFDDQGYVYLAYSLFGWGILKDDGGTGGTLLTSIYQDLTNKTVAIASFKTADGHYYVIITGGSIYDVTNRAKPVYVRNISYFQSIAKNSTADRVAIVDSNGQIKVYKTADLVSGGGPLNTFTTSANFNLVTSDGTNFYGDAYTSAGIIVSTIRPDGDSSYKQTLYQTSINISRNPAFSTGFQYGAGYIVVSGLSNAGGGWDLQILKLNNGVPSPVDIKNYVRQYYSVAPDGKHVVPAALINLTDGVICKVGTKYYLIVSGNGLGDVYEFRGADTVNANFQGCQYSSNCIPSAVSGGPFYGDQLKFEADATTPAPLTVQWNFDVNSSVPPASSADSNQNLILMNQPPATASGTNVTHQYSGLTTATFVADHTVSATNVNDSTMTSSVTVHLQRPAARFGLNGTSFLFKQPDASSPAPIVAGDNFFDSSDGEATGHWVSWTLDGLLTKTSTAPFAPTLPLFPVGGCGSHSLLFDAHYGPYTGSGTSLATLGSDYVVPIEPFNYTVRPFASIVSAPAPDPSIAGNVLFSGSARVSRAFLLSNLFQYKWDLVDANDNVLFSGPAGTAGDGSPTIPDTVTIPPWSLGKSSNSCTACVQPGSRVRLKVTSNGVAAGLCQGLNTSVAYSSVLNPPPDDLQISGGCTNGGPPCSFSVASRSGIQPGAEGWTYLWSVLPNNATAPTSIAQAFAPSFSTTGTYTISVTVANSVGSKTLSMSQQVTNVTTCKPMNASSVMVNVSGASSGCLGSTAMPCGVSEPISFSMTTFFGYDFSCSNHTYQWDFGDGNKATGDPTMRGLITHQYGTARTYGVTCTVNNGAQSFDAKYNVVVGGTVTPTPTQPTPTPSGSCGAMNPGYNVDYSFTGATSSCSQLNGTPCKTGEAITFSASAFGYSFACANHTFLWGFGNAGSGSGQTTTFSFSNPGAYAVSLTINNGSESKTITHTVTVQGAGGPAPNPPPTQPSGCGQMSAGYNVDFNYQNATGSCTSVGGTCVAGDTISFSSFAGFGYSFACATHSYSWDFGDGQTGSGASATNKYTIAGTYHVALTINNGSQSVTVRHDITIAQGSGATGVTFTFTVTPYVISGATIPNAYVFTASSNPAGAIPASSWTWDFGDNQCGLQQCTGSPVTHIYGDNLNHTITLSVPGQTTTVSKSLINRRRPGRH
jgi:PKD repeat protein